jgi:hypothetical protein
MFRLATVPQFAGRRMARLAPAARTAAAPQAIARTRQPSTADIRIRRFSDATVNEDSYSAILPSEGGSAIDLLRVITEACQDLPEFQIQGEDDERFVLTLTLKS